MGVLWSGQKWLGEDWGFRSGNPMMDDSISLQDSSMTHTCVCAHTHACSVGHMCAHMYTHCAGACVYMHTLIDRYTCMCTYIYKGIYKHIYICFCTPVHVHTYICTHTYHRHTYTHVNTYTHTPTYVHTLLGYIVCTQYYTFIIDHSWKPREGTPSAFMHSVNIS